MKKTIFLSATLFLFASCGDGGGGGVEGDAKKVADLACEGMKFRSQGTKGEEGRIKSEKALEELVAKMKEKYKDATELNKLIDEKLGKSCKATNPMNIY
jgi:hypothetical protein